MKNTVFALAALAFGPLLLGNVVRGAIIVGFEFKSNVPFSTIPNVSNSDLAEGKTTLRDFTGGNFDAALTTDGLYGTGYSNNPPNQVPTSRYKIDLGSSLQIGQVNSYAYAETTDRSKQNFTLYGSSSSSDPGWDQASGWTAIATVNTTSQTPQPYGGTTIYDNGGGSIGTYRWLMWVNGYVSPGGESSVFKEFDVVIAVPEPATACLIVSGVAGLIGVRRRQGR